VLDILKHFKWNNY